jgi:P-type Ca2+ transporter type 2C
MKSIAAKKFAMRDTPSSTVPISGLSDAEAKNRQASEGFNELPRPDQRTTLRIVLEVLREPMLALLLGGGLIYLLLGDLKEAIILLVFASMSVAITVIRSRRRAQTHCGARGRSRRFRRARRGRPGTGRCRAGRELRPANR